MKALLRNNLIVCILICVVSSLGMVNEASADIFADVNLVGFWQFSGDVNDSSYYGNDGTLYGDAYAGYDILELDGNGDYVDCGNDNSLKTESDLTISAWIRSTTNRACIYSHTWSGFRLGFGIGNNNYDGRLGFYTSTHGQWIEAGNSLDDDTWHHVAVTLKGTTVKLYTDSIEIHSATGAPAANLTGNANIGIYYYTWFFNGKIDDMMIYDAALEDWEIRQLYDEGNKGYLYSNEVTADVFRGSNCTATGTKAVALGDGTEASGDYSTAMGYLSKAIGDYSFAAGYDANAAGNYSTAFGKDTVAGGNYATVMGRDTIADGNYATAIGYLSRATGDYSFAAGYDANAVEFGSTAMGTGTEAYIYSTAMGLSTKATGAYCTAMGYDTTAGWQGSTAMGYESTASGIKSTAMGNEATASNNCSTAIGHKSTASGDVSTAVGPYTTASASASTAVGYYVEANEDDATALGSFCTNNVGSSLAVGFGSYGNPQVDFRVRSGQVNVYGDLDVWQKVTMGTLILPVKTTTGDPASPVEGQIYVNTYDNKVSVYADGAWRDLATW